MKRIETSDRPALRLVPILLAVSFLVVLALITATPGRAASTSSSSNCPYGDCVSPTPIPFFQTLAGEALIGGILAAAVVALLIVRQFRPRPGKGGGNGDSPGEGGTSVPSDPSPVAEADSDAPGDRTSGLESANCSGGGANPLGTPTFLVPEGA
jgi:hypothetical protein